MKERYERPPIKEALSQSLVLLSGSSNPKLTDSIGEILNLKPQYPISRFADGEPHIQIPKNLRNRDAVIIESTSNPASEHFVDLLLIADATKRASGKRITAVIPYYGFARQDRKSKPRESISSAVIARKLEGSVHHIITVDLHSPQIMGSFDGPWDNLPAWPVLLKAIQDKLDDNTVIVSPDKGGTARASDFAQGLNMDEDSLANVYKVRDRSKDNKSAALGLMGDVEGRKCLIVDDMIDTGGSIVNASRLLLEKGAQSVVVIATHGVFSNNALELIGDSPIDQVIITDSIAQPQEVYGHSKIKVVSVAPILAKAVELNQRGDSLSEDPQLFPSK
jgi:ribose-phosphate pyrophosphokinase